MRDVPRSCDAVLILVFVFVSGVVAASVRAERFVITSGDERTLVEFESRAPLESFTGRTRAASGFVVCTPAALGDSMTIFVEVDLASLDTGIGKRNADMREHHLETDRFPTAAFRGATLLDDAPAALASGMPVDVRLSGEFTLHGVSRRIEVTVRFTFTLDADSGPSLRAATTFPVRLDEYGISRPKFLFMKLGEEQQVTVDVLARAATSASGRPRPEGSGF